MRKFKRKKPEQVVSQKMPLYSGTRNVPRLTYEAWKKIFPDKPIDIWEESMNINDLFTFLVIEKELILSNFYLREGQPFPKMRIIVIDDEYFDWLKANGEEHTDESLVRYLDMERTDEDAFRLLKKHGWDKDYIQMGMPVIILNQKGGRTSSNYKLSKETTEKLKDYLEKVYVGKDVFLTGQILNQEEWFDEEGMYLNIAKAWFEEQQKVTVGKWDSQSHGSRKINLYELVIPFVVRRQHHTAVFDISEMQKDVENYIPEINLNKEVFAVMHSDAEDFTDSELEKQIVAELSQEGENTFVEAMTWYKENILEYNEIFREMLEEERKKSEFKGKIEEC